MDFTKIIDESFILDNGENSTSDEDRTLTSISLLNSKSTPNLTKIVSLTTPEKTLRFAEPLYKTSKKTRATKSMEKMNDSIISLESLRGGPKALFGPKKGKNKTKNKSQTLNDSRLNESMVVGTNDLSFDDKQPGLLKIYGSKIKNKHAHMYKTVLASPSSSAKELVKEALDRYSLPKRSHLEYVLCDVVGVLESVAPDEEHLSNWDLIGESKWVERGCRPLHDNDQPLSLQELWKPEFGLVRRLELRLKSDVFKTYKDTTTRLMNRNVRKIQKARAKLGLQGISEELEDSPESPEENITPTSSFSSKSRNSSQHNSYNSSSEPQETESGEDGAYKRSVPPPTDCPFLILLRGYSFRDDSLIYYLSEQITQIGSSEFTTSNANMNERTEVVLGGPDIKQQHCWIVKKTRSADKIGENGRKMSGAVMNELMVSIHPLAGAMVSLNGSPLTKPVDLKTGDLIALGQHYLFLYKDLTTFKDLSRDLYWLKPFSECNANYSPSFKSSNLTGGAVEKKEMECSMNGIPCLNYQKQHESQLMYYILNLGGGPDIDSNSFKLAPCYLMCCMIDFCSDVYGKAECKKLVYNTIVAFNESSRVACEQLNTYEHSERKPVKQCVFDLCELLKQVAFVMANSLELMNCLEEKKNLFSPIPESEIKEAATAEERVMLSSTDEQLFQILDEIGMETFQECVYQLTKSLSFILPTLLSSNPFNAGGNRMPSAIQSILDLLQGTLDTFSRMLVHPEVVEQLFGCLLFFTNSFLFNQLMERGSSGHYFNWSRGVQIRGNLDALESWLYQHSLRRVADEFLGKLNAVVDLLAWLKIPLMQTDWRRLRTFFPNLSASQLNYVLTHYALENQSFPQIWTPAEEDRLAVDTEPFYESMDGAPPLAFPVGGYIVKPNLEVPDESIYQMITQIFKAYPPQPFQNVSRPNSSLRTPKNSWRQQRSRNTPSVTRMFSGNVPNNPNPSLSRHNSKLSHAEEYNYIMENGTSTGQAHPNRNYSLPTDNKTAVKSKPQFESPGVSSSETLLKSSGTLKSGDANLQQAKAVNLPVMGINGKFKTTQYSQAVMTQDAAPVNSSSSGTFSSSSQNSTVKNNLIGISGTRKSSLDGKKRPIPKKAPFSVSQRAIENSSKTSSSYHSAYSRTPNKEYSSYSSLSGHQTPYRAKTTSSKEHADDSVSVQNGNSPRTSNFQVESSLAANRPYETTTASAFLRPSSSSAFVEINSTHQSLPVEEPKTFQPRLKDPALSLDFANKTFHAIDDATETQSVGGCTTMSEDREIAWFMEHPVNYSIQTECTDEIDADVATIQDDVTTIPDDVSEVPSAAIFDDDDQDYLVMVELSKINNSLGIGLTDGLNTPLKCKGVYIRKITEHGAAHKNGRLQAGDRIMAVDNVTISEMDYVDAMRIFNQTGQKVKLVVSKVSTGFAANSAASLC